MPTWSQILDEVKQQTTAGHPPELDPIRRRYVARLHDYTQRDTIVYQTGFTESRPIPAEMLSINDGDMEGLMEVVHELTGPNLDLILHSPGGSVYAAESLLTYLRSKFNHIRVIVPHLAMSAGTMIACAADVVVLGKHSFLGPIDPQLVMPTALGQRMVPALAVKQQFAQAVAECADRTKLPAWLPMLNQFGPDLLAQCDNVVRLARELVTGWLTTYMFAGQQDGADKATAIADWLLDHNHWGAHSRHIPRSEVEAHGVRVEHLESDQTLQDLVLSVHHACSHTFAMTSAAKLIENHRGKTFARLFREVQVVGPPGSAGPPPGAPPAVPGLRPPSLPRQSKKRR